ncbi:hypothetical protein BJV78DRAFT_1156309 [Lactifluus subvellereus]|nr:hypothetical protein BJV78DRAFT_1156309 [Lactifluus subvellereus]
MSESVPPLPAPTTNSVLLIRSSVSIDAPKQRVWSVLLDLPSYGEWNPWIRSLQVISDHDKTPLPSQIPALGSPLRLTIHTPPTMEDTGTKTSIQEAIVTHFDDANFRLAWHNALPRWILNADRWLVLRDRTRGQPDDDLRDLGVFWGAIGVPAPPCLVRLNDVLHSHGTTWVQMLNTRGTQETVQNLIKLGRSQGSLWLQRPDIFERGGISSTSLDCGGNKFPGCHPQVDRRLSGSRANASCLPCLKLSAGHQPNLDDDKDLLYRPRREAA